MKKRLKYLLLIVLIIPCLFLFSACNQKVVVGIERSSASTSFKDIYTITYSDGSTSSFTVENGKDGEDLNIEDIYAVAQENGYSGTFLEFLKDYLEVETNIDNTQEVVSSALLSSVSITAEFPTNSGNFLQSSYDIAIGSGSGVIYKLDKSKGDAYIITNYHVVYNVNSILGDKISTNIKCYLYGADMSRDYKMNGNNKVYDSNGFPIIEYYGNAISCEYIGGSMQYDIAVLKVSGSEILKNSDAVAVSTYNSDNVNVGSTAIAIGNPEGEGFSVTKGIVCVDSEYLTMKGADEATNVTYRVMRIDTPVNSGNSGGGLYNNSGKLIGIVNAKIIEDGVENIGYAIPSNIATRVANNIIANAGADKKAKKVTIGITLTSKNSHSVYNQEQGIIQIVEDVYIDDVTAGSLADSYGLKKGYQILSVTIRGVKYEISRLYQVVDLSWLMEIGDVVRFEIKDKTSTVNVIISSSHFSSVA